MRYSQQSHHKERELTKHATKKARSRDLRAVSMNIWEINRI